MNATIELIRLYAKQLKLPTIAHPEQLLREALAKELRRVSRPGIADRSRAENGESTEKADQSGQVPPENTGYF